jgi:hypothetical protein
MRKRSRTFEQIITTSKQDAKEAKARAEQARAGARRANDLHAVLKRFRRQLRGHGAAPNRISAAVLARAIERSPRQACPCCEEPMPVITVDGVAYVICSTCELAEPAATAALPAGQGRTSGTIDAAAN